jgi:hypothetical protein
MSERDERLIARLDECLLAISTGASVTECLACYPEDADELAPLLEMALALESLPQPGPSTVVARATKTRFLDEAKRRRGVASRDRARPWPGVVLTFTKLWRDLPGLRVPALVSSFATAALTLALILVIGGGVIAAASGSVPGDPLYGFKLLGEDIQRVLTFDEDGRARLEENLSARRRAELDRLFEKGRLEQIEFSGIVSERSGDTVLIDEIPVVLDERTVVHGELLLGMVARVHGITQANGSVKARRIEVEGKQILGRIESIDDDQWQVEGQQFRVDHATLVGDDFQIGDCVEVSTVLLASGDLLALEIEPSGDCPEDGTPEPKTPTPTVTAAPRPTPTATQTATPEPTETPEKTEEPTPTPSPRPSTTPSPTPSPQPSDELEPTNTPQPTEEPEETDEPAPTRESEPTDEPEPTREPEPTDEPEPTEEPEETDEPEPTDEPEETDEPEPEPTDEPEPTQEPEETDEPDPTNEPEETDEPEPPDEPEETDEPESTNEPNPTERP